MLQNLLQIVIPIRSFALSLLITLSCSFYSGGQSVLSLPKGRGKAYCPTSFACFPSKTGQQPVLLGGWWIGCSPTLFLESLFSYHFMLNMDGKGSPDLTSDVYPALKCNCSFLMETWVEQYLIEFYRTEHAAEP